MGSLKFEVEWEDPLAARGQELRATWASLRILVDNQPVTRVEDSRSGSVRSHLHLPLYPLAEWLAANWWSLLAEIPPDREPQPGFHRRHNLRFAREGYALPNLSFIPAGERTTLVWKPESIPQTDVAFLSEGSALLDSTLVRDELASLVETVIGRLDDRGLHETPLQQDWAAIRDAEPEEAEFCRLAARLGLDPYDLSDEMQSELIEVAGRIPHSLHEEFFAAANPTQLRAQVESLNDSLGVIRSMDSRLPELDSLRRALDRPLNGSSWEQGYSTAREVRSLLHADSRLIPTHEALMNVLRVDPEIWAGAVTMPRTVQPFSSLMAMNASRSPGFVVPLRPEEAWRFELCRVLFEFLSADKPEVAIATRTRSERQKRNRAFAAEFLAPAGLIRERLPDECVGEDDITDIAQEFGVSPFVIRHQIENHGLAQVS